MAFVVVSRWKSDRDLKDIVRICKQAKAHWQRHGAADFQLTRFQTGAWAGEFLISITFPNAATYGKALDDMPTDSEFMAVMAEAQSAAQLMGRNTLISIDV